MLEPIESLDILRYACFSHNVFQAWSSLTISRHRLETCEARTKVLGSSTNSRICRKSVKLDRFDHALAQHTLKQSSLGNALKGSFFSLGLTIWCRKLNVWLSHSSTNDLSQFSFPAMSNLLKELLASSRIGSSTSSRARLQEVGDLWCGVGLGAGVGGEAGAEGKRGLGMACGMAEVVFGVKGGFGWLYCIDSFFRDRRGPRVTGPEERLACTYMS